MRERKVLIEGYRIDPIIGYVAVKIDFLRSLRPDGDPIKDAFKQVGLAVFKIVEEIFDGIPGYVVVTDSELKIENIGGEDCNIRVGDEMRNISIQTTLNIEHTYVLKDGKYLCEWGDPKNPLHAPKDVFEKGPVQRTIEHGPHGVQIAYRL